MTGVEKLQHIPSIADYFSSLGIPHSLETAYAVSIVECVGGACLFLGLGARLAALALVIVMCGAIYTTERESLVNLFNDPQKLISTTPFIFLLGSLIVFIFGPGRFSLDDAIEKRLEA